MGHLEVIQLDTTIQQSDEVHYLRTPVDYIIRRMDIRHSAQIRRDGIIRQMDFMHFWRIKSETLILQLDHPHYGEARDQQILQMETTHWKVFKMEYTMPDLDFMHDQTSSPETTTSPSVRIRISHLPQVPTNSISAILFTERISDRLRQISELVLLLHPRNSKWQEI